MVVALGSAGTSGRHWRDKGVVREGLPKEEVHDLRARLLEPPCRSGSSDEGPDGTVVRDDARRSGRGG